MIHIQMATINNSDLSKQLIDGAKIQIAHDKIPNQLAEKVVPVMEVNPNLLRVVNVCSGGVLATTGNLTLATTPSNKDFYLTSLQVSIVKDATCDVTTGRLQLSSKINGSTIDLGNFAVIATTAQSESMAVNFNPPIKLDRTSPITLTGSYSTGVMVRAGSVKGYTVED